MGIIREEAVMTHQQVADVIFAREGKRVSRQNVQCIERQALRKLAVALAGWTDHPDAAVSGAVSAMARECERKAAVKRKIRAREKTRDVA